MEEHDPKPYSSLIINNQRLPLQRGSEPEPVETQASPLPPCTAEQYPLLLEALEETSHPATASTLASVKLDIASVFCEA